MKIFFISVVFVVALFVPITATQAAAKKDDLIKCSDSDAVYLLGEDGKRYVFPNEKVYKSWFIDFNDVKIIPCNELAKLPLGGNIEYQAGTRLVKLKSIPTVYAIEPDGTLRPIRDEQQAKNLFGEDWAGFVDDLSEAFAGDYNFGDELAENELPEGMLLTDKEGNLLRVNDQGKALDIDDVLDNPDREALFNEVAKSLEGVELELEIDIQKINLLTEKLFTELDALLKQFEAITVDESDKLDLEIEIKEEGEQEGESVQEEMDKALEEILFAEKKVADRAVAGFDTTEEKKWLEEARSLLQEAQDLFSQGKFDLSEKMAELARKSAQDAVHGFDKNENEKEKQEDNLEALQEIEKANVAIATADKALADLNLEGIDTKKRAELLDKARLVLEEAQMFFDKGDFGIAKEVAETAREFAKDSIGASDDEFEKDERVEEKEKVEEVEQETEKE